MEFRVLGPFEVRRDGRLVELRGSKRRAVLALLVLHANEVVRVERLVEEVWGENRPANSAGALQNHISRLRKDLGADVLVTKPWGYVLRARADEIDLTRFQQLVADAKPLPAHERAAMLAEALALWRGPPFADLADEPALEVDVARLEELRVAALEQRIDADLELGRHEGLIPELEALISQQPLRERLRGQLILALYRSGRQAEALETYRETRSVLVDELGIEPSAELRELERAILRQDPALASAPMPVGIAEGESTGQAPWRWPRSPLVVAGVLLLLVAGGVAGALLALRDDSPVAPPVAAGAAAPAQGTTIVVISSGAQTSRTVTVRHRKAPLHVRRRTTPAQQSRRPAPQPKHVAVVKRPVAAKTTKAQQAHGTQPYLLSDDFDTTAFDFRIWHRGFNGSGGDLVQRSGRVEMGLAGDAVGDGPYNLVEAHYGTNCRLVGDFDARVEFRLLSWPQGSGAMLTFAAWRLSATSLTLSRFASAGGDGYAVELPLPAVVGPGTNSVRRPSADETGALRLRRRQNFVTAYYRRGRTWEAFGGTPYVGNVLIGLQLSAGGEFAHREVRIAFDNFTAEAEDVTCPSGTPRPPRKPA